MTLLTRLNFKSLPWDLVIRVLIAIFAGYGLSQSVAIAIMIPWPLSQADKTLFALMLTFLFYCAYVIWVFSAVRVRTLSLGSLILGVVSGLVIIGSSV